MYSFLNKAAQKLWGDAPSSETQPPATSVAPASNAQAAEALGCREVDGGGGYRYRQHPDGAVEIVAGPSGVGMRFEPGDAHHSQITSEIGAFPAPTQALPQSLAAAEADVDSGDVQTWGDWAMDFGVGAADRARQNVEGLAEGADAVSARLQNALSGGYAKFFGTAETAQETTQAPETAPAAKQWADGFDEAAAQAHIDQMIDGWTSVEAGGVQVDTEYRNTETRQGYHDPVYGGLSEADMYIGHREMYYAIMGKASPEQLAVALQEAIDAGVVHKAVGKKHPDEQLTGAEIEQWNDDHFGVDCIGLVMNTLLSSDEYEDFVPDNTDGTDFQRIMAVNCRHFEAASTEVADPEQWRALDVITWTGGPGRGHVILIRAVQKTGEGEYSLDCVESAGSSGPRRATYKWNTRDDFEASHIPDTATVRRAGDVQTQPVAEALDA